MPIYEYACDDCRRIFQFFLRSTADRRRPSCPKCGRKGLERRFSRFAVGTGGHRRADGEDFGGGDDGLPDDADPARWERAMGRLSREMDSLDENNPRQLGAFMRRFMKESGEPVTPEMESAIRRLEAGEDPEAIEEDLGDAFGETDPAGDAWTRDDTLYDL